MKTKFENRKGRRIVVDGITWVYKIGRQYVVANSELGERRLATVDYVKFGEECDLVHRGRYKISSDGSVYPNDVLNWLKK